jgi:hypothetical protein
MFNNPYIASAYNPQSSLDRINDQINQLEAMKKQIQQQPIPQPTNLTQNFQLAPTTNKEVIRYANSLEEVQRDVVIGETPYFSKDMSVVWIKNAQNQIKTYELNEIMPKDEKDLQIELLQAQLDELKKGMNNNEQYDTNVVTTENKANSNRDDEPIRATTKESKPSSIQRVSTSKKR